MRSTTSKVLFNVGFGLAFPQIFEFSHVTDDKEPLRVEMKVGLSAAEGRYLVRWVSLAAERFDYEINGSLVRSVQFNETLKAALDGLHYFDLSQRQISAEPALSYVPARRVEMISDGPTVQSLTEVAKLYRIATVMRANQAVHIQHALQIPYATAANWITRARKEKLIESRDSPSFEGTVVRLPKGIDATNFIDRAASPSLEQ